MGAYGKYFFHFVYQYFFYQTLVREQSNVFSPDYISYVVFFLQQCFRSSIQTDIKIFDQETFDLIGNQFLSIHIRFTVRNLIYAHLQLMQCTERQLQKPGHCCYCTVHLLFCWHVLHCFGRTMRSHKAFLLLQGYITASLLELVTLFLSCVKLKIYVSVLFQVLWTSCFLIMKCTKPLC